MTAVTTAGPAPVVHTDGTYRVREPEHTWEVLRPRLAGFGITRVSDVTGLDVLGIPTAMAMRPEAWTLSVAQGKGQSTVLAKVSAAMEATEFWHAERARPPLSHRSVPARDLDLGYRVRDLAMAPSPFLDDDVPLDWVDAVGLVTGRTVPVPVDEVCFPDPSRARWDLARSRPSTNGLASGNAAEEAALHALFEVVERDALSRPSEADLARAPVLDPSSVADPAVAAMLAAVSDAGVSATVSCLPSRFGVPTFRCAMWSWDLPLVCAGSGTHVDPRVALSRAVTEAAQGRLAAVVGSRDDLDLWCGMSWAHQRARVAHHFPAPDAHWAELTGQAPGAGRGSAAPLRDLGTTLRDLAATVAEVGGHEPLLVDLTTDAALPVAKVLVPGAAMRFERVHARATAP